MESTDSSTALLHPQLPPGFRFHPTDEELVVHYLKRKAASAPLPVTIIADIDLYNFDPWELPSKANFGEQEWYFFSPRRRKYPNGARPNRAATSGYWKATGTDKPIVTSIGNQKVGVKKALVFYGGKPPKGIKTNWIMHEYRLVDSNSTAKCQTAADAANRKDSLRLDDWVLCRIYKKNNSQASMERDKDYSLEGMLTTVLPTSIHQNLKLPSTSRAVTYASFLENEENFFEGILTGDQMAAAAFNSSSKQNLSMALANSSSTTTTTNTIFPVKLQYWNTTNSTGSGSGSQSEKRFHGDLNSSTTAGNGIDENNSFVSLIDQLPQNAPFYPASLGDRQQFILPNMNWNP